MRFKDFLSEEANGKQPLYTSLDVEAAVRLLNQECKQSLWMLEDNAPLYRGDRNIDYAIILRKGFATVDPSKTERKSQNTSNYYTVILDNHPQRTEFPKRSRSFIGSTSITRADGYGGYSGGAMIMIPFDGAKIGIVGKDDMWDTEISLFGDKQDITDWNEIFARMGIAANIESFRNFDARLKRGDKKAVENFLDDFPRAQKYTNGFLEEIWRAYSAEATRHRAYIPSTLPHDLKKTEVWVGGPVMLISKAMWAKLRKAL